MPTRIVQARFGDLPSIRGNVGPRLPQACDRCAAYAPHEAARWMLRRNEAKKGAVDSTAPENSTIGGEWRNAFAVPKEEDG